MQNLCFCLGSSLFACTRGWGSAGIVNNKKENSSGWWIFGNQVPFHKFNGTEHITYDHAYIKQFIFHYCFFVLWFLHSFLPFLIFPYIFDSKMFTGHTETFIYDVLKSEWSLAIASLPSSITTNKVNTLNFSFCMKGVVL